MLPDQAISARPLGCTGLSVSVLALGCGPVSGLMTSGDRDRQCAVLQRAMELGVNWIDTAAGYGQGESESGVGHALRELHAASRVHVATKVRLQQADLADISSAVRRSVEGSLERLGLSTVVLLQLHNAITSERGQQEASLSPADVEGSRGVLAAFERLRQEGMVRCLGLTGVGQAEPLRRVVGGGGFDTLQVPLHLLNPSAGQPVGSGWEESDYGQIIPLAARQRMGVFAIRVYAAGALLGAPPSTYTRTSKFFPLDLYRRDQQRARRLCQLAGGGEVMRDAALRFAVYHPGVTSAIVGWGLPQHVDQAAASAARGPLTVSELRRFLPGRAGDQ